MRLRNIHPPGGKKFILVSENALPPNGSLQCWCFWRWAYHIRFQSPRQVFYEQLENVFRNMVKA